MDAKVRNRLVVSLIAALAWGGSLGDAWGQPGFRSRNPVAQGTLTGPSREITTLLQQAEHHIQASEWAEATFVLGKLLGLEREDDGAGSELGVDYFLDPKGNEVPRLDPRFGRVIQGSLFERVHALIDSMPDEAFEVLNIRHGVESRQRFDAAIQSGDWKSIEELSTDFGFLDVGQDATLLLAERTLSQGDVVRGTSLLDRLTLQKRALRRLGPQLGLMGAEGYLALGNQPRATALLQRVVAAVPNFRGTFHGNEYRWESPTLNEEKLESLMKSLQPKSIQRTDESITQPTYSGGDSRRNASTGSGMPLPILRWHAELHESIRQKDGITSKLFMQLSSTPDQTSAAIPSRVPISAGRLVISSTYDQRIVAVDLQSGLLQWECVYTGMPLGFSMEPAYFRAIASEESEFGPPDFLTKRVWSEASIGNLASDGEHLYGVSELGSIDVAEAYAVGGGPRPPRGYATKTFNVLQCWSIPEEGKLLWEVGGPATGSRSKLSNVLFLGPPLPYQGELLILGELNGEVSLLSLSRVDGSLNWRQPLVINEQNVVASDSLRKSIGASPTADGNIVLCPTLSGNLVAFDLHARTLLWGLSYRPRPSTSGPQTGMFGVPQPGDYSPFDNRSLDLSPIISDGIAIYAPPDGFGVYGVDLQTGERRWHTLEGDGKKVRYVGGVDGKTVLVVCQNEVYGINIEDGSEAWPRILLQENAQVIGRGVRNGGKYYLPTSHSNILEIDMEKGLVLDTVKLDLLPGNLVNIGDRLLSASPAQLDCYAIRDLFQKEVLAELGAQDNSISSLINRGELALLEGRVEDALDALEKAYELEPDNQDCWIRLRKASILAIQSDFNKYASRISRFKIGLEGNFEFSMTLVSGLLKLGRYEEATLKLFQLSDARLTRRQGHPSGSALLQVTPYQSLQEDRWIEIQISKCLEALGTSTTPPAIQSAIQAQVEQIETLQPNMQRLKLLHFRSLPQFQDARMKLAEEYLSDGKLLEAEHLLLSDTDSPLASPLGEIMKTSPNVGLALAKVYTGANRMDLVHRILGTDHISHLSTLLDWYKDWTKTPYDTSNTMLEPQNSEGLPAVSSEDWPTGKLEMRVTEVVSQGDRGGVSESYVRCQLSSVVGETLQGFDFSFSRDFGQLTIRSNALNRELRRTISQFVASKNPLNAHAVDGVLILEENRTLVAVDGLKRSAGEESGELWKRFFESTEATSEPGRGTATIQKSYWGLPVAKSGLRVIQVDRDGVMVLSDDEISSLDLLTGSTLWKLTGFKGASVIRSGKELYAYLPNKDLVTIDSRSGAILETRKVSEGLKHTVELEGIFLFADEQESHVRLYDPKIGKVVLDRKYTADTLIGLSPHHGLVALGNSGKLFYWNLKTLKEYEHQIALRDDELTVYENSSVWVRRLSLELFGDRLLVLPYNSRFSYGREFVLPPESDSSFTVVSGSVFAISTSEGKPLWESPVPVMQYGFPVHQDRDNSPVAVFVRRIKLPRMIDNKAVQMVCVALLDLRDGRVVLEKDDVKGEHVPAFIQRINPNRFTMLIGYGNVLFDFVWTMDEFGEVSKRIGFENVTEYRTRIVEMFKARQESEERE